MIFVPHFRRPALAVAFCFVFFALPTRPVAAVELDLAAETAVVSGLAPGGRAAVLSVWRERVLSSVTRVQRLHLLAVDDDGDGVAILDLPSAAPVSSLWVVVDLESGDLSLAAPAGYRLREITADPRGFRRAVDRLVVDRTDVELMAVRPGVGAWSRSLYDGGAADGDLAADGRVSVALFDLAPVGDTVEPVPSSLEIGDVVAAIDVRQMEVLAARITQ